MLCLATKSPVIRGNVTDQLALLQFKAEITGDQLKIMESWNSSSHFCQWRGVTCDRKHQRVTKLELLFLQLSGSLSPYIGNLSFLKGLNLANNNFYNQIPQEFGRLRRLETLELSNNSLSGEIPSNLSACSMLTFVHMRSNQLKGEIPASLGLLSNLINLRFYNNSLTGSIPPSLGNLSSLKELHLALNGLTGNIPETLIPQEFGRLRRLETLELSNNSLSGEIPSNLSACSMLTFVHMRSNQLKGEIPASLGLLSNLINLRFYNNSLTGSIPPSLGNLSSLKELHLALNGLTGNIPETLVRLTDLSFFSIGGNAIFGIVPIGMFNLSSIRVFNIGDNKIQGTLHSDLEITMPYVEFFSVRENQISGQIPISISNASNLNVLDFAVNRLSGNMPSTIMFLAVGWNKILGRIPDGIENLINLEVLEASGNELSGHVPFGVGRFHKLKKFYADNNFLSGIIPHSIGNLTMLMELALDINNLQGDIPSSLSKCQNLLLMGLSNNILSGPIPGEVIGLQSLSISLDLSSNYLTGSIPASLSLLRGLEALDVSDNNLSGGVPEFLVSFGALKYLNLSFNKFNGVIPSEGVFKNASATFVEGNNKLCGGIPELHLSRCNTKTSSNTYVKVTIAIVVVILGVTLKKKPTTCAENSLLQLSYQSILRATNEFSAQNLIGSGSFGSVCKGILEVNGEAVAVKVFNLLNRGASRSFLAECEALRNIRHRNLVKVLTAISGADYQGNDFKALVYKFMENGSLEEWLHPSVSMNEPETVRNLNFFQRVNMAIDVAHALEYLHHCCETSIIHCDLKPSNSLLDKEMVGHLSDFGLAKILSTDRLNYSSSQSSSLGLRGTIGYAPPEYAMGSELSTKGDVYSYGILLLEMFTGKRPTDERFKEGSNLYQFVKAALPDRVIEITDPILLQERVRRGIVRNITLNEVNLENDRRLHCLNLIFKIGLTCSVESRSERMDMSDVVIQLCCIRDKLFRPIQLHRGIRTSYTT
ncbi:hypothetical protein ES332_D10G282100v1 [Gossypium tomentosum]|uniref:non-specific serine/threonine protein kinase n=1 Tax=Gossypium tomentosum TaxID=34277 RepID=A0A5D2J9K4_GOSTO|nr:hypothetical protein ES332_D10G282100v1 [Gossypium tomentosum]